jgi:Amt family ammonium transporter
MPNVQDLQQTSDILFLILGAVMVFAMHAGFAFLELGSVRKKNQVNALVKILSDWSVSTICYFAIGFPIAYGIHFFHGAGDLMADAHGVSLVKAFFLLTFAACIPAIVSGGIAERAKFWPPIIAGAVLVSVFYPFFESLVWGRIGLLGGNTGWLARFAGLPFHDYAGSVVVHSMGGWAALAAILLLGPRSGRYPRGGSHPIPASDIPMLALGSWILCVGWFGFNVMSAQALSGISSLVAVNSLFAMVGGVLAALVAGKRDPGFVHNGALAGLIAVCAGSDLMHPLGALVTGAVAGLIFVYGFHIETEKMKIDDVLGVWPLHGVCGTWGGLAAGIFGQTMFGGMGGVSLLSQIIGTVAALGYALAAGFLVYGALKVTMGLRITEHEERIGCDLSVHNIGSHPQETIYGRETV